ncbi:MAG: D-2-hydroxyacid dehydrogenase [Actinomycetota bacterium]|nr:D-2-hydroxyacid dehydrogenase [Actinomycetota bacterium]
MSEDRAPVVAVMGVDETDPPPGIDRIAGIVELRYAPDLEMLEGVISDADVIYSWWGRAQDLEAVWPKAVQLRWVQAANVGVDGMLFRGLVESDVILTNAGGAADRPIAESVVGFIVAMAKGFPRMFQDQQAHVWGEYDTERISGQRLLVVGPGPIGRAIARACVLGLGMRAEAVGRRSRSGDADFERIRGVDDLPTAVAEADVVVDALPLTPQTRRLFDPDVFASMKPTARFVNIGRGGTVDEPALIAALRTGRIAGAALDVFEEEPLPAESPLWDLANVIISPHTSGNVVGWQADFAAVFYDNVERWIAGHPLRNVVDKRLGFPAGT